jgi:hypothetical protein
MQSLAGPSAARGKRRAPPVADDLAVADTAAVESDHSSDAEADHIVMGEEDIGYESSGYGSGESELEFRGCDSAGLRWRCGWPHGDVGGAQALSMAVGSCG